MTQTNHFYLTIIRQIIIINNNNKMKYNKYNNLKGFSQWCIIQYLSIKPGSTNKQMSKDFNCSKASVNEVLFKLK